MNELVYMQSSSILLQVIQMKWY